MIDDAGAVFVSSASIWEISIKASFGQAGRRSRRHGDPFDRLLVAQALAEPLALLTADESLRAYGPSGMDRIQTHSMMPGLTAAIIAAYLGARAATLLLDRVVAPPPSFPAPRADSPPPALDVARTATLFGLPKPVCNAELNPIKLPGTLPATAVTDRGSDAEPVSYLEGTGALTSMYDLMPKARIVPSFKDGVANGFKLLSIRPDSLYAKAGPWRSTRSCATPAASSSTWSGAESPCESPISSSELGYGSSTRWNGSLSGGRRDDRPGGRDGRRGDRRGVRDLRPDRGGSPGSQRRRHRLRRGATSRREHGFAYDQAGDAAAPAPRIRAFVTRLKSRRYSPAPSMAASFFSSPAPRVRIDSRWCSSMARLSATFRFCSSSAPMRSSGVNAGSATRSIESFSGA
jgi:hypothetical protein